VTTTASLDRTHPQQVGWLGRPAVVPSDTVPDQPGRLLNSEPLEARWVLPGAQAWRILYTTTLDEGRPA
jgi:hypothetical protein